MIKLKMANEQQLTYFSSNLFANASTSASSSFWNGSSGLWTSCLWQKEYKRVKNKQILKFMMNGENMDKKSKIIQQM